MTLIRKRPHRNGLLALSPLLFMALLFVGLSLLTGDFYKVPLPIIFITTSAYSILTLRGVKLEERIREFSKGAGDGNLMLMIWIFVLAGAFAASAKDMGAISATVDLTLYLLPANAILPGIFLAACFVSLSIGTSVGTIVALVPVATGVAQKVGIDPQLLVASAVGGAFFGDNLSFISDTTVVATRTQGCRLKDKFLVNFRIVLPAALVTLLAYIVLGQEQQAVPTDGNINLLKVLPYIVVLVTALMGMNVILVLFVGNLLTGVVGVICGGFDMIGWISSMAGGIGSMGELILISMLAGGLLQVIRRGGGITWLIRMLTRRVISKTGAELSIAGLVSLTNLCTANNTVAILSVGQLSRDIARRYNVDNRKAASILDTFSCCVQGLIPYGAQLLMASGLSGISPFAIIPYLYYPMSMGVVALLAIFLRYPRKYS